MGQMQDGVDNTHVFETPEAVYSAPMPGPFAPSPAAAHATMGDRAYSRYPAAAHAAGLPAPSYPQLMLGARPVQYLADAAVSPAWAVLKSRGVLAGIGDVDQQVDVAASAAAVFLLSAAGVAAIAGYFAGRAMAPSKSSRGKYGWYGAGASLIGGPLGLGALGAYGRYGKRHGG